MEILLASVFLSLSTNLDNFAIGATYSLRHLAIALPANLLIASLSGMSTFMAMSLGSWLGCFLTPGLSRTLGSGVLIAIGLISVARVSLQWFLTEAESNLALLNCRSGEARENTYVGFQEALVLGLALTITNFGTGVGAGMSQLNTVLTSCLSFFSSLLTIGCGSYFGSLLISKFSGEKLEGMAGVVLISLGVYEYCF